MKRGDKYPVTIAGQVVAQAEIREVGDGTATLVVPGTIVVMATRTELSDAPTNADTSGTQTIIEGVERSTGEQEEAPVEAPEGAVGGEENATPPVVEETSPTSDESVAETTKETE